MSECLFWRRELHICVTLQRTGLIVREKRRTNDDNRAKLNKDRHRADKMCEYLNIYTAFIISIRLYYNCQPDFIIGLKMLARYEFISHKKKSLQILFSPKICWSCQSVFFFLENFPEINGLKNSRKGVRLQDSKDSNCEFPRDMQHSTPSQDT